MLKTVGNPSVRYGDQTISGGNLIIGTAGKGVDFSSDPSAPGMTSELLDDYEEGTWTPTGFNITLASSSGKYTKVGNVVHCTFSATFPATADGSVAYITGLPFTAASDAGVGMAAYNTDLTYCTSSGNTFLLPKNSLATAFKTNASLSTQTVSGSFSYQV